MSEDNKVIMSFSFTPEFSAKLKATIPEKKRSGRLEETLRPFLGMPPLRVPWPVEDGNSERMEGESDEV